MKKLCVVLLMMGAAVTAFAQSGIILDFSGEVELKLAGSSDFIPAGMGDAVDADTIISTGFKSTALIEVGSSTIAVRPLTRLSLAEIHSASGTETLKVNLHAGRVKVDVKPPAGTRANCTVQSPSATASVRGTSFEFDTLNLTVNEGTVSFQGNSGMAVLVPAGENSYVNEEGKTADPIEVAADSLTPSLPAGADSAPPSLPMPVYSDFVIIVDWDN